MDDNPEKKIFETIVNTLAFFDLFDYPLTLTELWRWGLWADTVSVGDVADILLDPGLKTELDNRDGFYFLSWQGRIS